MLFGHICLFWVELMVISFLLGWQSTHSVNLNCLGYSGSVSVSPRQGLEKFKIQLSFSCGSPCPFVPPNHLFLPLYQFPKWLLPSLPTCTSLHSSLSHLLSKSGESVRIRTRCMSTSPTWRTLSRYWFVSGMNFCFSTTDTKQTRRKQELIFSISWCHPAQYTIPCPD